MVANPKRRDKWTLPQRWYACAAELSNMLASWSIGVSVSQFG
jgi:hypothetical protein